jgi:hypothetical protein
MRNHGGENAFALEVAEAYGEATSFNGAVKFPDRSTAAVDAQALEREVRK